MRSAHVTSHEHARFHHLSTPRFTRPKIPSQYVDILGTDFTYRDKFKRAVDISGAFIGIFLLFPLMILIAIAIRIDSPGAIIFRQKRVGRNRRQLTRSNSHTFDRRDENRKGQIIEIYKFRTMKKDTNKYAKSPQFEDDSRITPVGRFLRSTCLDELPQLFNVLKGDISLVGPRPEMEFIVKSYGQLESLRLHVKPGITGLWQIYGSREKLIHEDLKYDFDYMRDHSLKLDISILCKTIKFIFIRNNL